MNRTSIRAAERGSAVAIINAVCVVQESRIREVEPAGGAAASGMLVPESGTASCFRRHRVLRCRFHQLASMLQTLLGPQRGHIRSRLLAVLHRLVPERC